MFRKEVSVVTAVDFLHMYLEFNTMTPDKKDWTRRKLAKSPPWLNRLVRLEALIKAFGLRTKLVDFHNGYWIDWRNSSYDRFFEAAGTEDPKNPLERWDVEEERHTLLHVFVELLDYRIRLEKSLDRGSVGLSCNGAVFYAHRRIASLSEIVLQNLSIVEEPLVTIIDPENRSFHVADLARDFGYPEADLNKIDLDWIV
jgi:hypothetical protein